MATPAALRQYVEEYALPPYYRGDVFKAYARPVAERLKENLNAVTAVSLDERIASMGLPSDDVTARQIANGLGQRSTDYHVRFVVKRLHWIARTHGRAASEATAAMIFFFAQIPPLLLENHLAGNTRGLDAKPLPDVLGVGDFYFGVSFVQEMRVDPRAYMRLVGDEDLVYSVVGTHYFFLKNKAHFLQLPTPETNATYRALDAAIRDIYAANDNLAVNIAKLRAILAKTQTRTHSLVFQLVKAFHETDYANIAPTVLRYDNLLADVFVPTVLL
jgi:hypothetical protein